MFTKKLLTILFTIFILTSIIAQDAKIATFPVTPYMIANREIDTSVYKSTYTGLKTVGIGDLVYLVAANPATLFTLCPPLMNRFF